jgi:hypothetical protein
MITAANRAMVKYAITDALSVSPDAYQIGGGILWAIVDAC